MRHCSDCYNPRVMGSDLWTEFRLNRVYDFLLGLYGRDGLSDEGLKPSIEGEEEEEKHQVHDLVPVGSGKNCLQEGLSAKKYFTCFSEKRQHGLEGDRVIDKENFNKDSNEVVFCQRLPS